MFSYARTYILLATFLIAAVGLAGCGATTSSSVLDNQIGKKFSVTGSWVGTIEDVEYGTHTIEATLNSSESGVTGTIIIPTHDCLGIEANRTFGYDWRMAIEEGALTPAEEGSEGDNILTPEQENSNSGMVEFQTMTVVEGEDPEYNRYIRFTLNGNSDVLSGRYSGTWVGPSLYCRSGLQGTISISRR